MFKVTSIELIKMINIINLLISYETLLLENKNNFGRGVNAIPINRFLNSTVSVDELEDLGLQCDEILTKYIVPVVEYKHPVTGMNMVKTAIYIYIVNKDYFNAVKPITIFSDDTEIIKIGIGEKTFRGDFEDKDKEHNEWFKLLFSKLFEFLGDDGFNNFEDPIPLLVSSESLGDVFSRYLGVYNTNPLFELDKKEKYEKYVSDALESLRSYTAKNKYEMKCSLSTVGDYRFLNKFITKVYRLYKS